MSETNFKEKVQQYLNTIPDLWHAKIYGNAVQKGGIPDILICYKGQFIALELKDPNEKNKYGATARQLAILRRIEKAGGTAQVIDSLDKVKALIERM